MTHRLSTLVGAAVVLAGCGGETIITPTALLSTGNYAIRAQHVAGESPAPERVKYAGTLTVTSAEPERITGAFVIGTWWETHAGETGTPATETGTFTGERDGAAYTTVLHVNGRELTLRLGGASENPFTDCSGTWRPLTTTGGPVGPAPVHCVFWRGQ